MTQFDPRAARMPGSTKGNGGVAPGSWAGSGDHPDTQAPAVSTTVVTVPSHWTDIDHGCAVLPVIAREALAVDFYRDQP